MNKSKEWPLVSIIMPIRNEENVIGKSLNMIISQDYPQEKIEIIISDGMSTDKTREIIEAKKLETDVKIYILDNKKEIAPTAMNLGIKKAKGDIIMRIDGHAVISKNYVRDCVTNIKKYNVDCVGGAVTSLGKGYIGKAIAMAMSSKFGVGSSGFRTTSDKKEPFFTDTVPFGAYRRSVFAKIGLFNEKMVRHQDYEFCYRLRKSGGKILLLPKLRANYYVRSTLGSLWKQYWQYGIWKGRFIRTYTDSVRIRHAIPPIFVLCLIMSAILSIYSFYGKIIFIFALTSYFLFIHAATLSLIEKDKYRYAFVLPLIFTILHFSWGIGIYIGFLKGKIKEN